MVYSDRSGIDLSDEANHQNSKFSFRLKVLMEKLLKIIEIATLPKKSIVLNYRRYRFQILIA